MSKQSIIIALLAAIASPLMANASEQSHLKCRVYGQNELIDRSKHGDNPVNVYDIVDYKGASNCRSLNTLDVSRIETEGLKRVIFYADWGCAGYPIGEHDSEHASHEQHYPKGAKSCELVPKESSETVPKDLQAYLPVHVIHAHGKHPTASHGNHSTRMGDGDHNFSDFGNDANSTSNSFVNQTVHAAVLFEGINFSGIKHWIDGRIGECRGLSGVPINSVKMVSSPGADPDTSSIPDDVTIAFYDQWGCSGNIIGAVTGSNADVTGLINQTLLHNATVSCEDGSGNSTSALPEQQALSIRWVATGVGSKFWYDGRTDFSTESVAGAGARSLTATGLVGLVAAAAGYLFA